MTAGVARTVVYGAPLPDTAPGTTVVEVPVEVADLFARAHRRMRPVAVAVHRGDGEVRPVRPVTAVEPAAEGPVEPAQEGPDEPAIAAAAAALRSARRPVVLAGPGVVEHDAVDGLRALAAAAAVGVLNTWGAKGVFDWRSPHHLGTAGLQARDFELGGLAGADLIVATGVDPAEATADWRLAPVAEVHPSALARLAEHVRSDGLARRRAEERPAGEIERPPLFAGLARVTQAGWERAGAPLAPTRVTRTYGEVLGGVGVVAADPGPAGFWVARTVPTTAPGDVFVSADATAEGSAAAAAVVARLLDPDRPVLAVVDELGPAGRTCVDVAARKGVPIAVERWHEDGDALDAEAHRRRLQDLLAHGGEVALATDPSQLAEVVAVAGEITAWGGPVVGRQRASRT